MGYSEGFVLGEIGCIPSLTKCEENKFPVYLYFHPAPYLMHIEKIALISTLS